VHHGEGLLVLTEDEDLVRRLQDSDRAVVTDAADTAMLDYVEKLTLSPSSVQREDVDGLRAVGFSDADVLDIAQVTAYYAFVNRLAEGLGVELEPHRR
jgi:uncharacterized peroxidase-related enzyme